MFFDYHILKVACEYSSDTAISHLETYFQGNDEADCMAKARADGWVFTDHRSVCRAHARAEARRAVKKPNSKARLAKS